MSNQQHYYGGISIEDAGGRLHHRRVGSSKSSASKLRLRRPRLLQRRVSHSKPKPHHVGGTASLSTWLSRRNSKPLCPVTRLKKLKGVLLLIIIAALTMTLAIRLATGDGSTTNVGAAKNPLSPLFKIYMSALKLCPLPTKMTTGAFLATAGDAVAQGWEENGYDPTRGASFAAFDTIYRIIQHWLFPSIVKLCRGQYLFAAAGAIGAEKLFDLSILTAMERSLASQLIMVPFLYYPIFFCVTGFAMKLSFEEGLDRAKLNFVPLMKRNLLFGIPVQYIQFCYVPTDLQIPFLSCTGLVWTFLLSFHAGSAKKCSNDEADHDTCCVIGIESDCVVLIPEEEL